MRNEKISIDPVRNQGEVDFFGSKTAENSFFLTVSSTEPTQTNYRYPTLTLAIDIFVSIPRGARRISTSHLHSLFQSRIVDFQALWQHDAKEVKWGKVVRSSQ